MYQAPPRPQAMALRREKQEGGQALMLILAVLLVAVLFTLPVINRTSYGLGGSAVHPALTTPPEPKAGPALTIPSPQGSGGSRPSTFRCCATSPPSACSSAASRR